VLKYKLCEAAIHWKLECSGPLLIRDERYQRYRAERSPTCLFISRATEIEVQRIAVTIRKDPTPPRLPYYIPGTSIRGPFRAHAERIIRTMLSAEAASGITACDPFEQDDEHNSQTLCCSKRLGSVTDGKRKYDKACPACKLFGCAGLASRIRFSDADVAAGYRSVYRDMIGIDRFTGGVYNKANMRFHALEQTKFSTTVTVSNFELWQLGLLAYVFRDFSEGLVPIGYGKTKGFGRVQGAIEKIILTYPTGPEQIERIEHIGSLTGKATLAGYGIAHDSNPPSFECEKPGEESCLSLYRQVEVTNIPAFWEAVAPSFKAFIEGRGSNEPNVKEAIS